MTLSCPKRRTFATWDTVSGGGRCRGTGDARWGLDRNLITFILFFHLFVLQGVDGMEHGLCPAIQSLRWQLSGSSHWSLSDVVIYWSWSSSDVVGLELYDHARDAGEDRNLAWDKVYAGVLQRGVELLESYIKWSMEKILSSTKTRCVSISAWSIMIININVT